MRRGWLRTAGALMLTWGVAVQADDCSKLAHTQLAHVTISAAQAVAAGSVVDGLAAAGVPAPTAAYCRVQAIATPSVDSQIRFEVWMPLGAAWNGKYEQVGNGGFAGAIPYQSMARVLALGYAVAGTDDGHQATDSIDGSWALKHPEKIKDYGWRAIDETARASKALLRAFKKQAPSKSYFVGCSDGGREALMMAQRYPTYFDGIVAGAPAYAMTRLLTNGALRTPKIGGPQSRLSAAKLALLQHTALDRCGGGAGYLQDPRQCHLDLDSLRCSGGETESCLTEPQISAARLIYAEGKDPVSGGVLYAVLPGAEAVKGSWDAWITGHDGDGRAAGSGFTWNYLAYMVMDDPQLDVTRVTAADIERGERLYAPIMDSSNPDLTAFKSHGGKLIQYHGWNDPGIAPGYSVEYQEKMRSATAGADAFYRLYMVPGMLHCGGGDAPTQVNWQAALEAWVERGVAPAVLTAADGSGRTQSLTPFGAEPSR